MKKLLLLFSLSLLCAALSFGQGVVVAPQTAFKVVNGLTTPIANATITVCAANTGGKPCSPALANSVFSNSALTLPLSNPFFADSTGNYQFAIAPGNYTVTVTNLGFTGQSYQLTVATPISLAGGLGDPGANGVVYRNGLNTTRVAASADIIALFSGACSVATFIRGDGSCAAAANPTFDLIGSGTNTSAAMRVGNGASLQPLNFGRNISTASWLYNTDPEPSTGPSTWTAANTGGSLQNTHTYCLEWTLVSAVGETTPTAEKCQQPQFFAGTCSGNTCTIALPAPTLPTVFTGYTVYARDQTSAQSQQQIASCVNITGSCTFGSIPTTSSPPTTNAVMPLPTLAKTSVCPANVTPTVWVPDANGNLNSQTYLSEFFDTTAAGGGPTNASDAGVLVDCRPRWFSDNPTDPPGGKNAFFLVDHLYGGSGLHAGNQDRAVWLNGQNPANDAATRYGLEVLQAELDFNCNGCTINGSPDAEVTSGSFQLSTAGASTNWTTTGYQTNAIQGRVFRNGAGFDIAGINGVYSNVSNGNATSPSGATLAAFRAVFDGTASSANMNGIGIRMIGPATTGRFGHTFGILSSASFTPAAFGGITDYFIDQRTHNWNTLLNGGVGLTSIENTDGPTQALPINASVNLTGALATSQIASSWTTGYSASCTGGASNYIYTLVAGDVNGGQVASATFNCATGINPLTGGNPATLNVGAIVATSAVYRQAVRIDVYRTGGPMALGKVGSLTCNNNIPINSCNAFVDNGLSASGTVPSVNTTGGATVAGYLHSSMNTVQLASDFTGAANTSLQTIGVLTWNLDANAKKYSFHCSLMYSQATAAVAMQFGIQAATVNPNDISAKGRVDTQTAAASAQTTGILSNLATTTATSIVTFTPSATATVFGADLDGSIDNPANNQGQVVNIMVQTSNSGDLPTVKRGSYCTLY